jgi:hypothetical protein
MIGELLVGLAAYLIGSFAVAYVISRLIRNGSQWGI